MTEHKMTIKDFLAWSKGEVPINVDVGDTILIVPEQTGSDKVRELLKQCKPVLCGVSISDQESADIYAEDFSITSIIKKEERGGFIDVDNDVFWKYASPVDLSNLAQWEGE